MYRDFITLGKLGRPHGVVGEINFIPNEQYSMALLKLSRLYLGEKKDVVEVLSFRESPKGGRILFKSHDSRESVKNLTNLIVFTSRNDLPLLDESEYYLADLIGATVRDVTGKSIGLIQSYYSNGAQEIASLDVGVDIPLIKGVFIKSLCIKEKEIRLLVPEEDLIV
tara:strand:- start:1023 stop:1523 length:501 start_codon:yes stop_codon:yes gene_type:complete